MIESSKKSYIKYPKISVIIPVYNVEKYLSFCIESVLNQTYKNLEIILIDDGSTDGSNIICDSYAKKDNRIIVIHKVNEGQAIARNVGLENATGEYIAFVDSDDYISKDLYEKMYSKLSVTDADMIIFNCICVDEFSNEILDTNHFCVTKDEMTDKKECIERLIDYDDVKLIVIWNKLYKKEVFNQLRFEKGIKCEDEVIVHHIIHKCKKILWTSYGNYYYRKRTGSVTSKKFSVKNLDYGDALIDRYKFAKKNKYIELKDNCIEKLIFHMNEWKIYREDIEYKNKYKSLRKNSLFLIYEKNAWKKENLKGKIYARLEYFFPKLAIIIYKMWH